MAVCNAAALSGVNAIVSQIGLAKPANVAAAVPNQIGGVEHVPQRNRNAARCYYLINPSFVLPPGARVIFGILPSETLQARSKCEELLPPINFPRDVRLKHT